MVLFPHKSTSVHPKQHASGCKPHYPYSYHIGYLSVKKILLTTCQ
jgi:hypothetical protein